MKAAVLFNPDAGGNKDYATIARGLAQKFAKDQVITCEGYFDTSNFENVCILSGDCDTGDYIKNIHSMVFKLIDTEPDIIISVGGDGFASYIAEAIILSKAKIPLIGIAGGTANVGPIVNIRPEDIKGLNFQSIRYKSIGAVEVSYGQSIVGYGFNDVVIGDTFLGMVNSQPANIDIETFLEKGLKKSTKPSDKIVTCDFTIKKNEIIVENKMKLPSQIVISPIDGLKLYGKAVTGALCIAPYINKGAVISLIDYVVVSMIPGCIDNKTITTEHLLFDEQDSISISGLSEKGHVIIDGNPFIRRDDAVNIRYIPQAITTSDI